MNHEAVVQFVYFAILASMIYGSHSLHTRTREKASLIWLTLAVVANIIYVVLAFMGK